MIFEWIGMIILGFVIVLGLFFFDMGSKMDFSNLSVNKVGDI